LTRSDRLPIRRNTPGTIPEAITAFLESQDFEDAVRKAVSLGGDSDTLACITGGIAQAFYGGIPKFIEERTYNSLGEELGKITREFMEITPVYLITFLIDCVKRISTPLSYTTSAYRTKGIPGRS
jgi:hypothetical protein